MVRRQGDLLLYPQRILDKRSQETGDDMPLNVAVEEPDTGVVGLESQNHVTIGPDDERIATHGLLGVGFDADALVLKGAGLLLGAVDGLEVVTVEMEGVAARVEVVEDNLDNLVLFEDKRVCVLTVDGRVDGVVTGREHAVEGGHLGLGVGDVVEEGIVFAVAEVVHDDVELDLVVRLGEQVHLVVGLEGHVVERVELGDGGGCGLVLFLVVGEPAGDIVIELWGEDIKEGLGWLVSIWRNRVVEV